MSRRLKQTSNDEGSSADLQIAEGFFRGVIPSIGSKWTNWLSSLLTRGRAVPRISFEIGLAIGGLVLTIILLVLDKADKLRGPTLYWLLAIAALMTLPLVFGNAVVMDATGAWKYWVRGTALATWGVIYTALGIWISSPKIVVAAMPEIVARVYARGLWPQPPATSGEYKPFLQELFYEWVLTLTPDGQTGEITVRIKDPIKHLDDRIKIEPDIASISDIKPMWMSGFEEPSRKPDYYERVIRSLSLEKKRPARIIFRRPIKIQPGGSQFTPRDFSRSFEVTAEKARIIHHLYPFDDNQQFVILMRKMETLGKWKYSGPDSSPLSVRENPDVPLPPLGPSEIETTLEVRCEDASCQKIVVRQLEARKGAP